MKKQTLEEVFDEASKIRDKGSYTLKAIGNAKRFLHQHEGYFVGEEAEELGKEIARYAYNLESKRERLEKLTLDEVLYEASKIREEDKDLYPLMTVSSAKRFLDQYEDFFSDEEAKQLSNEIAKISQNIELEKAKIEKRTVDEVFEESFRIQEKGKFSLNAISDSKAFLNQYIDYFDAEEGERFGNGFSRIFQDLEEAMFKERGPRKPRSEEDIREQEKMLERAGIISI
jgi:hypothetical protein